MLPLGLLTAAKNRPMLVELKNGETFNGHLIDCDPFMNLLLREAYRTSPSGQRFWKMNEVYIRGSVVKYIRVPDTVVDQVREHEAEQSKARAQANRRGGQGHRGGDRGGRGNRGGRGGGRGRRGNNFS